MLKVFEKKLRLVRLRWSVNLLLKQTGRVLTCAGIIAVLGVLTERLLGVSVINSWTLWVFGGVVTVLVFLPWLLRQPSRMQTSLLLDERLRLHERFSTTLALADSKVPFANAARNEAHATARHVHLQGRFPIRPSRCWLYVISTWVIAAALVLFMPQKDLLGLFRRRQQEEKRAEQIQQAEVDVKEATDMVRQVVKRLDAGLAEELGKLGQLPEDAKPTEIKREVIRKLGDLSDRIQKMQTGVGLDSVNLMQQMFKQLRGSADVFSQKLRQALAKGDFAQASNLLNQMQKQLMEGKLSEEQQKALSEQLKELAKQLQELARRNAELEKELEKLGLDKRLAKLSEKQLREALQKQGLSAEKVEELLQKAAACRMACSRCAGLGQGMAACGAGGLSGDELAEVMEQLNGLEAMKQQLMLSQASLAEINRAIACLGQGMCKGLGGQGPFMEGLSEKFGPGTGGPGRGYGPRSTDQDGETSIKKTRVEGKSEQGPVIASWYFKGTQIKGEARRDFSEVIQAGRDSAAEAISENQIPRKYEEAVKKYFSQLEESGGG